MLEDHADAELAGLAWRTDGNRLALPDNITLGGCENAEQHLDERGFARAVFTQKLMNFARRNIEIDAVAGSEIAEQLGQLANGQERHGLRRHSSSHEFPLYTGYPCFLRSISATVVIVPNQATTRMQCCAIMIY
ncbi:hypothetical protein D3C86_1460470 [compost metagenome]